jgi:hypothetical protein
MSFKRICNHLRERLHYVQPVKGQLQNQGFCNWLMRPNDAICNALVVFHINFSIIIILFILKPFNISIYENDKTATNWHGICTVSSGTQCPLGSESKTCLSVALYGAAFRPAGAVPVFLKGCAWGTLILLRWPEKPASARALHKRHL